MVAEQDREVVLPVHLLKLQPVTRTCTYTYSILVGVTWHSCGKVLSLCALLSSTSVTSDHRYYRNIYLYIYLC